MRRIIKKTAIKPHEGTMITRPITDPQWNASQMNTRVRMSKKERLKQRRAFREAMKARGKA